MKEKKSLINLLSNCLVEGCQSVAEEEKGTIDSLSDTNEKYYRRPSVYSKERNVSKAKEL